MHDREDSLWLQLLEVVESYGVAGTEGYREGLLSKGGRVIRACYQWEVTKDGRVIRDSRYRRVKRGCSHKGQLLLDGKVKLWSCWGSLSLGNEAGGYRICSSWEVEGKQTV